MIHIEARLIEADADVDLITNADKNGIFVAAFLGWRQLAVAGNDLELSAVDMERMATRLHHHAAAIANDPGFGFTKWDGFVDPMPIKGLAIDGAGDAHGL